MNSGAAAQLKREIAVLCDKLRELPDQAGGASYGDKLALWEEIHAGYLAMSAALVERWAYDQAAMTGERTDEIMAEGVAVEIVDKKTGRLYRRNLPVHYYETDNGVVISGETLEGAPARIAFLSEAALARLKDVMGKGRDSHRCGG